MRSSENPVTSVRRGRGIALPVFLLLGMAPATVRGDSIALHAVRDNTLIEDPAGAWSNGSGPALFTGRTSQGTASIRRALIAFDPAGAIPPGSRITAATLTLNLTTGNEGGTAIALHAVLGDWGEGASSSSGGRGAPSAPGDATWIHSFYDTRYWQSAGGDFLGPARAAGFADLPGPTTWGPNAEMVADVQRWLDEPADNHGWILIGDEGARSTVRRFDAREQADPALRPVLRIEYSPPCRPAPLGPSDWRRQCLMLPSDRRGPGASLPQPSTPLDPDFEASIVPCADAWLTALGAAPPACDAVLERPLGEACDRAVRQLATLAFNLCAGRLQTSCEIGPEAAGCGTGDLGDLLDSAAAWLRDGDCRRVQGCAAATPRARP